MARREQTEGVPRAHVAAAGTGAALLLTAAAAPIAAGQSPAPAVLITAAGLLALGWKLSGGALVPSIKETR